MTRGQAAAFLITFALTCMVFPVVLVAAIIGVESRTVFLTIGVTAFVVISAFKISEPPGDEGLLDTFDLALTEVGLDRARWGRLGYLLVALPFFSVIIFFGYVLGR